MRATVSFAQSAVADLDELQDWYADQGAAEAGRRLIGEIVTRIDALRRHPESGRIVPEFRQRTLRELIHPPFRIVYRLDEPARIRIVRIWRGERRLKLPDEPAR